MRGEAIKPESPALVTPRGLPCGAGEVRGFIDGRKTQFRRPCKGLGVFVDTEMTMGPPTLESDGAWIWPDGTTLRCPFGGPGDELWVREKWSPDHAAFYPHFPVVYAADVPKAVSDIEIEDGRVWSPEAKAWYPFRWRSSTTMPRHLSRLTLAVVAVRVERLQDITGLDAWAEGVNPEVRPGYDVDIDGGLSESGLQAGIDAFHRVWDARHSPGAWEANPWCWCVTVRVPGTAARGGAGR